MKIGGCLHRSQTAFCYTCSTFTSNPQNITYKDLDSSTESYISPSILLRSLESSSKQILTLPSSYIECRKVLLDWMSEISDSLKLCSLTLHSAVYLLDFGVSTFRYESLQALALIALTLASKSNEIEEVSPKISDYSRFCSVPIEVLQELEIDFLMKLDWNITITTPLHFLEVFLCLGVVFQSDVDARGLKVADHVKKYALFLADFCLEERIEFSSKDLGVAYVAVARKLSGLCEWKKELADMTGTELNFDCFFAVHELYAKSFNQD